MARYDLTDFEWSVVEPILPNKSRGVSRVDDRRVLNGIFGCCARGRARPADLPERYGPRTTCYNRFLRWTKAAVWDRIMDAITEGHGGDVRFQRHERARSPHCGHLKKSHPDRGLGQSRGGLTMKIHGVTDEAGLPLRLAIMRGQIHDAKAAGELLSEVEQDQMLLGDRAYDADWIRKMITEHGAWASIPPRSNRKSPVCLSQWPYKARNAIERFFNKLKSFRRIATRYDKVGSTYRAMIKLTAI